MKKFYLFIATIALLVTACSKDEDLGFIENGTGNGIEFRTLMDKPSSGLRAAITDETSLLSFTVTGIKQSNTDYLFNGFGITKGEDASWDYTPKRYWPKNDKVDFYAYSPSSSKNVSTGITNYVAGNSITYTVPQISKKDAQEDFLVARVKNKNSSPVTLNFHHALSRLMFFARTTQKNVTYTIDKIELVNLYETGDLNLENPGIIEGSALTYNTTTPLQPWVAKGNRVNYTVDLGQSPIYMLTNYASVLGETNAVMILPQTTALSTTGSTAPASGKFAIKVSYKAFVDDIYYAGTATNSEVKYFAVKDPVFTASSNGITFEMGRQYNFYLEFGDEVGDAISFNVAVSDWTNAPAIYLPEIDDYSSLLSADLIAKVSDNNPANGKIDKAEIEAVTSITANTATFDFKGLEYFTKINSIIINGVTTGADLNASQNKLLTSVSITGSTLGIVNLSNGELTTLTLSGNNTFTSLDASNNKLSNVNLGTGTITGDLDLSGNPTLTSIDLTNLTVAGILDLSNCSFMASNSVIIESSTITTLNLSNNQFATLVLDKSNSSTLGNLDISNNTALTVLTIVHINITGELNAKGNTALNNIKYGNNNLSGATGYTIDKLDVQNSNNITKIEVYGGNTSNGVYKINNLIVWDSWTGYLNDASSGTKIISRYGAGQNGVVTNVKNSAGTSVSNP